MDEFSWDFYKCQDFDWDSGYEFTHVFDPTSFRIVNETTGEAFKSLMMFVASFDHPGGIVSDYFYYGR